ncbi:xanthine dehydrogenase family protein subunit M [Actibacterium sp. 188UL27-1]|uniref:FAD binding domain-containing protein n=1 Tax=Actibacterium sp. 188UL27-1 TaxID=2786961 RepID=UPI00195E2D3E|nr:FAD binding domain-containing protein [Actibacterium sp. 188UL27-1]MBM7066955.1 FAD binding domain-containing protein [Actibacterium sp. 188UL27-1]
MTYHRPTCLDDAVALLQCAPVEVIAGGTDWYPARGDRPVTSDILDITRVDGLRGIRAAPDGWWIGAATTWTDILRAPLPPDFDALKAAACEVGSIQIQNAGTVAGNLCNASPAADGVPPLLVLEAEVELASATGQRRLPLAAFLTGVRQTALQPGEMMAGLWIRKPAPGRAAFVKLGARRYLVISIAMVAVWLRLDGSLIAEIRIAVGACSPTSVRLTALEAALTGCRVADCATRFHADHFVPLAPITDMRADAPYRADAVQALIARAITEAAL